MFPRTLLLAAAALAVGLTLHSLRSDGDRHAAAPMADSLPAAGCQAFGEFPGLGDRRDAWEQTAAYDAMVSSGLLKTLRSYVDQQFIGKLRGNDKEQVGFVAEKLEEAGRWAVENGAAAGVWFDPQSMPQPVVAVILPQPQTVIEFLEGVADELGPSGEAFSREGAGYRFNLDGNDGVSLLVDGDRLIASDSMASCEALKKHIAANRAPVSGHPLYMQGEGQTLLGGFVDLELVQQIAANMKQGENEPTFGELASLGGLGTLTGIQWRQHFDGELIRTKARVNTNGSPEGAVKIKLSGKMSLDDVPPVPANTPGFACSRVDVAAIAADVKERVLNLADKYNEPGDGNREDLERQYAELTEELGFDPIAEALPAFGDLVGLFDDASGGPLSPPTHAFISVRDKAKIVEVVNTLIEKSGVENGNDVAIARQSLETHDVLSITPKGSPVSIIFGLSDDWAVIGPNPMSVNSFFERVASREAGWQASDELLAANPELGGDFVSMTYIDTAQTWQRGMMYTQMAFPMIGAALKQPLPPPMLPSASRLGQKMSPNVIVITGDDSGAEIHGTTSAPPFPLGSSVAGGIALPAIGMGLVLPAVGQARTAARRSQSKNNIKQIALGAWNYHDTWENFPAASVDESADKEDDELSFYYSMLPFLDQKPLYDSIDENKGWNDPANRPFTSQPIEALIHPKFSGERHMTFDDEFNEVEIKAPTYYRGNGGLALEGEPEKAGIFRHGKPLSVASVKDGTSNTIMVFDSADPVEWADGGAAAHTFTEEPEIGWGEVGGIEVGGLNVGMTDGSVRFLSESIDPEVFKKMLTSSGNEVIDEF